MRYGLKFIYPDILNGCVEASVGAGWYSIIKKLLAAMKTEQDKTGIAFHVLRVKEEMGGLRCHYNVDVPGTDEARLSCHNIRNMVAEAERESFQVCEKCGVVGSLRQRSNGWYVTLCHDCYKD